MRIETERLILREWRLDDAEDLAEGLGNFETAKNLTVPFPYTTKDAIDFIAAHLKNTEICYEFAVELKQNGKVIGATSLDAKDGIYRGGIWLNEGYTERRYGTEVWIARAKFAFEILNLT